MYKIAHITDTHIKYDDPEPNSSKFKALLDDALSAGWSHILLTGDIADYADERDYKIIREILGEFDLLNSEKLSVIPGNHDIYGGPSPDIPFFLYPTHCKQLDYKAKINLFYNSFIETFEYTVTGEDSFIPYIKMLNDNIAIIAINSIAGYSKFMNPLGTNGYVSKEQIKTLEEITEKSDLRNKIKIVIIHHHFNKPGESKSHPEHVLWLKSEQWKMRLHNKGELFDYFKKNKINMVLHGHTHITDTYARKGSFFVNSSGGVTPFTISGEKEYYVIEIDDELDNKKLLNLIKRRVD